MSLRIQKPRSWRTAPTRKMLIRADHPQRGVRLHHPAAGGEPGAGEIVVGGEARELVPVVIDRIDPRIVRALEIAGQLQIVGRIGEHEIDARRRHLGHGGNAVADQDARRRSLLETDAGRPDGRPATRHNHDSEL